MTDRMEALRKAETRAKCPECGKWNKCAMGEGKSASTCWCMLEAASSVTNEYSTCLCRTCFRKEEK